MYDVRLWLSVHVYQPSIEEQRQEGQMFKVILSCLMTSRSTWATQDHVLKT